MFQGSNFTFSGCFRIRISSPIHLDTWMIFINNLKRLKNAKNACADIQKEQCSLSWNEYSLLRPATQVMPELCHLCTELRLHWTLFALDFVCTGLCLKLFWFQQVSPLNPWQGPECAGCPQGLYWELKPFYDFEDKWAIPHNQTTHSVKISHQLHWIILICQYIWKIWIQM